MKTDTGAPRVFDFTDYRVFLRSFYDWKKRGEGFSYAVFSKAAGLKSRSFLRLVVSGKRNLSSDGIAKFIVGLELKGSEAEAFGALVQFNQASDFDARKHYWESFLKLRPKDHRTHRVHDEYKYLARMSYPSLLILLRQNHVEHDLDTLADLTGMTVSQVKEGIETFKGLGILREGEGGRFEVSGMSFETPNDLPSVAIQSFHRNMLERARECTELPHDEREFQSVMMPLSREEFFYLKKKLREIADEMDQKFSGRRSHADRIYAMNLNVIPLTPSFIRNSQEISSQEEVVVKDKDGAKK